MNRLLHIRGQKWLIFYERALNLEGNTWTEKFSNKRDCSTTLGKSCKKAKKSKNDHARSHNNILWPAVTRVGSKTIELRWFCNFRSNNAPVLAYFCLYYEHHISPVSVTQATNSLSRKLEGRFKCRSENTDNVAVRCEECVSLVTTQLYSNKM